MAVSTGRLLCVEPKGPRGTASPRTAAVWSVLRAELERAARPLTVLDVGGGTGGFAVPLATMGHRVTVIDASPDALAALTRRAAEAGVADRVRAMQGDGDALADLVPPESADLVLCHSLLEIVDEPATVVKALAASLRPGGAASAVVANRVAAVLARAVSGHLDVATALLTDSDGQAGARDTLRRRFDLDSATRLLTAGGLVVEQTHGVRVVADLLPGAVLEGQSEALLAFELATSSLSPYREMATQLHLFARRPAG
ncbi:methyltransferase domain-containing protein [Planosporangium thailandense]|uniref:Methyltransferase domain-containing protein n=1 Tax=Planosporangium thailandense TaxID=765197 RepID=A0ABX0XX47_9ACTN|nr:methyltransferase domain-containing protein [Planosporangium thailandense]NJC69773.1 methyltransferase domain-containing protein [Planosporangium thailandense]